MHDIKEMTFKNWQDRKGELGQEAVTVTTTERKSAGGYTVKDKEIVREKVTAAQLKVLEEAHDSAAQFGDEPRERERRLQRLALDLPLRLVVRVLAAVIDE